MRALWVPFLAAIAVAGCGADEPDRSEAVTPADPDPVLALVHEGDSVYAARTTRLERIDVATGQVARVAGPEWSECPASAGLHWRGSTNDRARPGIVFRGTIVYLVQEDCGLWSFDVATGARRTIADAVADPTHPRWSGSGGPAWRSSWGMAIAADGDGLVACMHADAALEVWSIRADGSVRDRLASVGAASFDDHCNEVVVDDKAIFVSTSHAVMQIDRGTRKVTTLLGELAHSGATGLAVDADSVFYIGEDGAILKNPRDRRPIATLREPQADPNAARAFLALDGDHLYFYEGAALKRMSTSGGEVVDVSSGGDDEWAVPVPIAIGGDFVYFEKAMRAGPHRASDVTFTLLRARK